MNKVTIKIPDTKTILITTTVQNKIRVPTAMQVPTTILVIKSNPSYKYNFNHNLIILNIINNKKFYNPMLENKTKILEKQRKRKLAY